MVTFGIRFKDRVVRWETPPPPPGADWPKRRGLALALLTPEQEQDVYRMLELPRSDVKELAHQARQVRAARQAREDREAKERVRARHKAQQQAASKAKSQALQRAAREAEGRAREAAFERALAKRDALAAEAGTAAEAETAAEARTDAAPSPRKRNHRQQQRHKQADSLQEVGEALLAMQVSGGDAPPPESDPEDERLCSICMEGEKTHACLPCGHRCLCAACAGPSFELAACPICRAPVLMRARIFV
jgi:hypothetical protein